MKEEFNKPASPAPVIFLDIDGVIADFDSHATACGKKDAKGGLLWDALDLAWWAGMPAFAGAKTFYDDLKKIAPVKFLTAPIMNSDCFKGKAEWVQKFLPEKGKWALMDLIICPSSDKHFLTRPNAILVDDRAKNITEWVAAGGIGILHKGDFAETLRQVKAALGIPPAPEKDINPALKR